MKRPLSLAASGPARLWNSLWHSKQMLFQNIWWLFQIRFCWCTFDHVCLPCGFIIIAQENLWGWHGSVNSGRVPPVPCNLTFVEKSHHWASIWTNMFLSSFSVASFAAAGIWCRLHLRFSCMQPCQPFDASMSKGNIVRMQSETWQIRQSTIILKPMLTFAGCQWEPQPEWIEQPLFAPALSNFVG